MFTVTPAAAGRILESARQSDAGDMALRVAAKIEAAGSCPPSSCGGCGSRGGCSSGG